MENVERHYIEEEHVYKREISSLKDELSSAQEKASRCDAEKSEAV